MLLTLKGWIFSNWKLNCDQIWRDITKYHNPGILKTNAQWPTFYLLIANFFIT